MPAGSGGCARPGHVLMSAKLDHFSYAARCVSQPTRSCWAKQSQGHSEACKPCLPRKSCICGIPPNLAYELHLQVCGADISKFLRMHSICQSPPQSISAFTQRTTGSKQSSSFSTSQMLLTSTRLCSFSMGQMLLTSPKLCDTPEN